MTTEGLPAHLARGPLPVAVRTPRATVKQGKYIRSLCMVREVNEQVRDRIFDELEDMSLFRADEWITHLTHLPWRLRRNGV